MNVRKLALASFTALAVAGTPIALSATPSAQPAASDRAGRVDAQIARAFGDTAAFKAFYDKLKDAVTGEKKMTVARMVSYPFKTMVGGEWKTLKNRWQFVEAYDRVIRPGIVVTVRDQDYADLIVTEMGVAFGSGDLWFGTVGDGDKAEIRIIAINQNVGA